jgi:hypothetical protein
MPNFCFYERCFFEINLTQKKYEIPKNEEVKMSREELDVSKIHKLAESDSDDGGMASGIMTPPKRNEEVISEKTGSRKGSGGSGVDVDELEAYLKKNVSSPPKEEQKSMLMVPQEPLPKSKDSSFSDSKDKAGYFEQAQKEKVLVSQNLKVTPLTDFREVHSFLKDGPASDKFFVRNFANNGSF